MVDVQETSLSTSRVGGSGVGVKDGTDPPGNRPSDVDKRPRGSRRVSGGRRSPTLTPTVLRDVCRTTLLPSSTVSLGLSACQSRRVWVGGCGGVSVLSFHRIHPWPLYSSGFAPAFWESRVFHPQTLSLESPVPDPPLFLTEPPSVGSTRNPETWEF